MMFYPESVSPELLQLLKDLMLETELEEFILGGGTSLSLRFGHRQSIDLDLFTIQPGGIDPTVRCLKPRNRKRTAIERKIEKLFIDVNYKLPEDVKKAIVKAESIDTNATAKDILSQEIGLDFE